MTADYSFLRQRSSSRSEDLPTRRFRITGRAAHARIAPLLPKNWIDVSPTYPTKTPNCDRSTAVIASADVSDDGIPPDFIWENAPCKDTQRYRDHVLCYNHLPNGTAILDSKWVLARLFSDAVTNDFYYAQSIQHPPPPLQQQQLESFCFRGVKGLRSLASRLKLERMDKTETNPNSDDNTTTEINSFVDLLSTCKEDPKNKKTSKTFISKPNLWVIKDAASNGAGGVWIVGRSNFYSSMVHPSKSPLHDSHMYVAQKYAWPPVLYDGRKCHVRVYGLLTADGCAYVHNKCFLHVANEPFSCCDHASSRGGEDFPASVHITNCCANSHDPSLFVGEICASLEHEQCTTTIQYADRVSGKQGMNVITTDAVPVAPFANSIYQVVAAFAERSSGFVTGGEANGGFEYLGFDFLLSSNFADCSHSYNTGTSINNNSSHSNNRSTLLATPTAYLLEVNAPPSQDTATGLLHAEDVHNTVIKDLISLWVLPQVLNVPPECGGWKLVYQKRRLRHSSAIHPPYSPRPSSTIIPSRAALLNKMKWALFERKYSRRDDKQSSQTTEEISVAIRSFYPFYDDYHNNDAMTSGYDNNQRLKFPQKENNENRINGIRSTTPASPESSYDGSANLLGPIIYFENAGGSQVPRHVIEKVCTGLRRRDRSTIGRQDKETARCILHALLGANPNHFDIYLGSNATTLLRLLAQHLTKNCPLSKGDEVILCVDNHLANLSVWCEAVEIVSVGDATTVIQWSPRSTWDSVAPLVTSRTRIVALSHASNVLGKVRESTDFARLCQHIRMVTQGRAHVVVDGVAAAPHVYSNVDAIQPDWYVISCHKLFGPHLGVMVGRKSQTAGFGKVPQAMDMNRNVSDTAIANLEVGTVSYEACSGIHGLGQYFCRLAEISSGNFFPTLSRSAVQAAYLLIDTIEMPLIELMSSFLTRCPNVRLLIEDNQSNESSPSRRIPTFCFVHQHIPSSQIVEVCCEHGIHCRSGTFLSCPQFQHQYQFSSDNCVVRISLSHYNTIQEIYKFKHVMEAMSDW